MQNSLNFIVRKSSLQKKWQTLAIIQEIWYLYTNLDTGGYGPKSGVSRIFQESCQHCTTVEQFGFKRQI